jgi:nucleoside 2-deoxyribosyltransferase
MRKFIEAASASGVVLAPETPDFPYTRSVFLAGSIDMGAAVDWQKEVADALLNEFDTGLCVFNPRRDDWDSSWVQDISNEKFAEQVRWELQRLEEADVVCVYFDPEGQAPITLMELGLHAREGKLVVCCPEGYWRRGNVQVVCDHYDIPMVDTIEELIDGLKDRLK